MNKIYAVCGIIAILGFVLGVKEIFSIFSIICLFLIYIGFLLIGFKQDNIRGVPSRKFVTFISRTITYCVLVGVLYHFFPNIVSWCVDIYCASAIFNLIKEKIERNVTG